MLHWSRFTRSSPSDRFFTTYSTDFNAISKRNPQLKARTTAELGLTGSLQSERETLPVLFQHLYATTNTADGSAAGSQVKQPPSGSLFPAFLPSFGSLTSSFSEEIRGAEVALQEPGAGTVLPFGVNDEDPRHNVCGQRANTLKQQKDEPNWKTDVHYEEGVIVLSPYRGPIRYEEFLQFMHKEARPPHLLTLPSVSSPFIRLSHDNTDRLPSGVQNAFQDSGTRENCLSLLSPAVKLQNSPFLQPSSRRCSHCRWKSEHPLSCCCGAQSIPPHICQSSLKPLAHRQRRGAWTEPSRVQPLTEYQASYSAQRAQPQIRQI